MKNFPFLLYLLLSVRLFSIDPSTEYIITPAFYDCDYHELKIQTEDLCDLNTWVIEPKGEYQGTTILIAGSDAGNMGNSSLISSRLAEQGYRVVTFDYRGFGDSTDFQFDKMKLYHDEYIVDFKNIISWCKKEYPNEKTGVLAYSMGTLVTTLAYEEDLFDFMIGECFITDPNEVISNITKHKNICLELPKSAINYEQQLKSMNLPKLIIEGKNDLITPLSGALKESKSNSTYQIESHNGGHLQGVISMGIDRYIDRIHEFIWRSTDQHVQIRQD